MTGPAGVAAPGGGGSSGGGSSAHVGRKRALFENRREREFYRYYEPIRALTEAGAPVCDLKDPAAAQAHRPFSSPDPALTAFCQLGALRLNTRRAMLLCFDANYTYILAEATRTLSLKDDAVHDTHDGLWMGHAIIPRGFTICEETVCRMPADDGDDDDGDAAAEGGRGAVHVIHDLTEDARFCDGAFVTDGPKLRFYAGVPITTPKGVKIGAYCLLDDKKRDSFDDKGVAFLQDMASTIMKHLDACRAKAEHVRGTRMISGLGAFIEGASHLRSADHGQPHDLPGARGKFAAASPRSHSPPAADADRRSLSPTTEIPPRRESHDTNGKPGPNPTGATEAAPTRLDGIGRTQQPPPQPHPQPQGAAPPPLVPRSPAAKSKAADPAASTRHPRPDRPSRHTENLSEELVPSNVRTAFQRAADLVCEAVDVEGAMFLDAAVETYGGLVEVQDGGSDHSSNSDGVNSGTEATGTESEGKKVVSPKETPDKPCKVLAASQAANDLSQTTPEMQALMDKTDVTEKFLKSLLRRYGRGKIWNFNEDGNASSDDESSESGGAYETSASSSRETDNSDGSPVTRRTRRRRLRCDDGREIQRVFPGVRSLALMGMWDQSRGRWFSACVVWTYSPLRLFSHEAEVSYLAAFCDVVMAEVHRIEAQNSDRAKSDFISSISHELRTPLHGILGSVETLQEQPTNSFSAELIAQVEVCGRTLLDIVDHLLDYSKLSGMARMRSMVDGSSARRRLSSTTTTRASRLAGMISVDAEVALDEVTEEVVEAAVYSFGCIRDKQTLLDRKVSVILDVDAPPEINWKCRLPLGGWKRICINLVSNALKYTREGYIRVSLKAEPIRGKRKRFNVVFEVADSGQGMSKEFLNSHLFKAFSQEDSLAEGTGLGMSLVAKIVMALGGKIEVQSEKGVGTTMTVTVMVDHSRPSIADSIALPKKSPPPPFEGSTIGIIGLHDAKRAAVREGPLPRQLAREMLLRSVEHICQDLRLRRVSVDGDHPATADLYVITEEDLLDEHNQLQTSWASSGSEQKPLIVLCNNHLSLRQLRLAASTILPSHTRVEYIAQPYGPRRLHKAVEHCLGSNKAADDATSCGADGAAVHKELAEMPTIIHAGPPAVGKAHQLAVRTKSNDEKAPEIEVEPVSPRSGRRSSLKGFPASEEREAGSEKSQLGAPSDGILARSRSTGDRPESIFPLDPVVGQKNVSISPGAAADASSTRLSLLLVDDNQINLQLLVNYATKQGHLKTTATDGLQAVEVYKSICMEAVGLGRHIANTDRVVFKPDVVLMDINMPILNGFEATRQIRAFEQQNDLRPAYIIALTGLGSASAQQEAFSSGVDLFLTKPVRLNELTKLLDKIRNAEYERAGSSSSAMDA